MSARRSPRTRGLGWVAVPSLALGLIASLAWISACGAPSDEPRPGGAREIRPLQPGERWTLSFPAGESREIPLPLDDGWYLELAIHQQGVDVISRLVGPEGETLQEIDTLTGDRGTEEVLLVAQSRGEHRLRLEAGSQRTDGHVEVEVREVRPASPEDRQRAAASAALARARLAWIGDDPPATERAVRAALPVFVELGDRRRETEARHLLGRAFEEQERWSPAAEELERAREGYRELGRTADEALASNQLGRTLRHLGRPLAAEAAYRRALSLAQRAGAELVEAGALHNLGRLAQQQGELEEALDLFEQALALSRRIGPPTETARFLARLGNLYTLIGRDADALVLLEEGDALSRRHDGPADRARALDALAWARHWAGESEQALSDYATALGLAQETGDEALEVDLLARRATVLWGLGRLDEARADFRRVLRHRTATGEPTAEGQVWANLGWVELEAGNPEAAQEAFERAAERLADRDRGEGRFVTWLGLGKLARRAGRWREGRRYLETAVVAVEDMRLPLTSRLSRGYVLSVRYEVYEELIGLLMDRHREEPRAGYDRQALEVAERARARGLLEDLAARGTPSRPDAASPTLRRIRGLELERLELQRHRPDSPRLERLDEELRRLWLEAERTPQLAASRRVPPPHLSVPGMQALLDEDTRLVVFSLGEPRSHVWVVSPETVRSYPLAGRRLLSKLARETAAAMAESEGSLSGRASVRRARELSRELLAPAAKALDARRLVIVPDGALHLVPFAALPDPAGDATGDALVLDRFEIAVAGSPSALALQRQTEERSGPGAREGVRVALLADPVYESDDPRLDGTASPDVADAEPPTDLRRSVDDLDLSRLGRLVHTRDEARAILARLPAHDGFLAEGVAARRELVIGGGLSGYPILHFAAHGLVHPVHPELSGVVLSLFDQEGRARDGFLRAYEVARLDLPARLVVLSACRTALGHEVRGEAPLGLVQAFFRAGSRRVLASNWSVDDAATAELMDRFYAALLEEGHPPAAALRRAQLALRHSEDWSEPYYWAAFQLHGDWRGSFSQQTRE